MAFYNIFNNVLSVTTTNTGGAVSSVAGKTGAVTLVSSDVTDFQPSVSVNSDVSDNKSKTINIDKTLTVLNSTKLNGNLIATKFRSGEYYDETGASGMKIIQTTGEIILNSNLYISNIGKFLKIDTNGLIIADVPTGGSGSEVAIITARTSVPIGTQVGYNDIQLNTLKGSIQGLFLNSPVFSITVSGKYKIEAFGNAYQTAHTWLSLIDLYNVPGGQYVDEDSKKLAYAASPNSIDEISNAWVIDVVTTSTYALRQYSELATPIGQTGNWSGAIPWSYARVVITKF